MELKSVTILGRGKWICLSQAAPELSPFSDTIYRLSHHSKLRSVLPYANSQMNQLFKIQINGTDLKRARKILAGEGNLQKGLVIRWRGSPCQHFCSICKWNLLSNWAQPGRSSLQPCSASERKTQPRCRHSEEGWKEEISNLLRWDW